MKSGDCVNRLFPGVEIKQYSSTVPSVNNAESLLNQIPTADNSGKFLACAIMEMKPISVQGYSYPNQVYSKSEVVVKGENYGWIMGTFISSAAEKKQSENSYSEDVNFLYRLLFLKKSNDKGEVTNGLDGNHFTPLGSNIQEKLVISPPLDKKQGFHTDKPRGYRDSTPFQEKVWAGIGEVDDNPKLKDLLQSFDIYTVSNKDEFWGSKGDFSKKKNDGIGYVSVQYFYVKDEGWKRKEYSVAEDVSSKLRDGYKPFKERKIRGTNLSDRCNYWSGIRNRSMSFVDSDMQALCYHR